MLKYQIMKFDCLLAACLVGVSAFADTPQMPASAVADSKAVIAAAEINGRQGKTSRRRVRN